MKNKVSYGSGIRQSLNWLMKNNKDLAYQVVKNAPKKINDDIHWMTAIEFQDMKLLDIYIARQSNQTIKNKKFTIFLEAVFSDKNFKMTKNSWEKKELIYNFSFLEALLKKEIGIVNQEDKEKLFSLMIHNASQVMADDEWQTYIDNNIKETLSLFRLVNQYNLLIENQYIIKNIAALMNTFSNVEQWNLLLNWIDNKFIAEKDREGNNILHLMVSWLNTHKNYLNDTTRAENKIGNKILCTSQWINRSKFPWGGYYYSINCHDIYKFCFNFIDMILKSPFKDEIINAKNNDGFKPFDLAQNSFTVYMERKINYDALSSTIKNNNKKRHIQKV